MSKVISEINNQTTIVNQSSRLKKQLNEKQKELEKIIFVTDNLYMDWKSEEISRNDYSRMKSRFEIKAEKIRHTISNI
ncbi:hypothetical protein ACV3RS_15475 [Clostridium perfringens]